MLCVAKSGRAREFSTSFVAIVQPGATAMYSTLCGHTVHSTCGYWEATSVTAHLTWLRCGEHLLCN